MFGTTTHENNIENRVLVKNQYQKRIIIVSLSIANNIPPHFPFFSPQAQPPSSREEIRKLYNIIQATTNALSTSPFRTYRCMYKMHACISSKATRKQKREPKRISKQSPQNAKKTENKKKEKKAAFITNVMCSMEEGPKFSLMNFSSPSMMLKGKKR